MKRWVSVGLRRGVTAKLHNPHVGSMEYFHCQYTAVPALSGIIELQTQSCSRSGTEKPQTQNRSIDPRVMTLEAVSFFVLIGAVRYCVGWCVALASVLAFVGVPPPRAG